MVSKLWNLLPSVPFAFIFVTCVLMFFAVFVVILNVVNNTNQINAKYKETHWPNGTVVMVRGLYVPGMVTGGSCHGENCNLLIMFPSGEENYLGDNLLIKK